MPNIRKKPHKLSVLKYHMCPDSRVTDKAVVGQMMACDISYKSAPPLLRAGYDVIRKLRQHFNQWATTNNSNALEPTMYVVGGVALQAEIPTYIPGDLDILCVPPDPLKRPDFNYMTGVLQPWLESIGKHKVGDDPKYKDTALAYGLYELETDPVVQVFPRPNGLLTHQNNPGLTYPLPWGNAEMMGYFQVIPTPLVALAAHPRLRKNGTRYFRMLRPAHESENWLWARPQPGLPITDDLYHSTYHLSYLMEQPSYDVLEPNHLAWFQSLADRTGFRIQNVLTNFNNKRVNRQSPP